MNEQRPLTWEDDLSTNTLDDGPFDNLPCIGKLTPPVQHHGNWMPKIEPWLKGRDLEALIAKDTYPLPACEDREGYSQNFDPVFWITGLIDYLKVQHEVERLGIENESYLDFGCASGRVLRHFAIQSSFKEIWGTDINARHIRWLLEYLPSHIKPVFNHTLPTLPLPDSSINLITAFSVFTHIDTFETAWLAELRRILSPGGLAYITVHNEDTWEKLQASSNVNENRIHTVIRKSLEDSYEDVMQAPLDRGRIVYRHTSVGPYRGVVFHQNEYLQNVWGRFFEIESILPCHHNLQSVMLLRRT